MHRGFSLILILVNHVRGIGSSASNLGKTLKVSRLEMADKLDSLPSHLAAGTVLAGRYEIVSVLAKGGMGMVYKARQIALDRIVAVKVLPLSEDPRAYQRFELEAKASAALNHPNIVSVYDYGQTEEELPYLIMEFIEGKPLSRILRQKGRLPESQIIPLFTQVCDGLFCAHNLGLVHRD